MSGKKDLQGLRGWLILVGIIVVISPVQCAFEMFQVYVSLFHRDEFIGLITIGSDSYKPNIAAIFFAEIALNLLIFTFSLWVAFLFFSKSHLFPKMFLGLIALSLVFHGLLTWGYAVAAPWVPVFDQDTIKAFVHLVTSGLVWGPYMLLSMRVRLTFVRGRSTLDPLASVVGTN